MYTFHTTLPVKNKTSSKFEDVWITATMAWDAETGTPRLTGLSTDDEDVARFFLANRGDNALALGLINDALSLLSTQPPSGPSGVSIQ